MFTEPFMEDRLSRGAYLSHPVATSSSIESYQKTGRITTWEENLDNVEMFALQACEYQEWVGF
jgi:hypothetical protein